MNCLDSLFKEIAGKYDLSEIDTSEYKDLKVKGMKFDIKAYVAKGLGHVSVMKAKGFFGLMNMDTLIINPIDEDLPLYSYDRILAMGNDTVITELYDTLEGDFDLDVLDDIVKKYKSLPYRNPGEHWYDDIKLSGAFSFNGKKEFSDDFDKLSKDYLTCLLELPAAEIIDKDAKKKKALRYVDGLLKNGGPSTDVFLKVLGREKTEKLFHEVLFGV